MPPTVIVQPQRKVVVTLVGIQGPPGPPGTTDHGSLSGLTDNDHPQYLLKSNEAGDANHFPIWSVGGQLVKSDLKVNEVPYWKLSPLALQGYNNISLEQYAIESDYDYYLTTEENPTGFVESDWSNNEAFYRFTTIVDGIDFGSVVVGTDVSGTPNFFRMLVHFHIDGALPEYSGRVQCGIYRSQDGGTTWKYLETVDYDNENIDSFYFQYIDDNSIAGTVVTEPSSFEIPETGIMDAAEYRLNGEVLNFLTPTGLTNFYIPKYDSATGRLVNSGILDDPFFVLVSKPFSVIVPSGSYGSNICQISATQTNHSVGSSSSMINLLYTVTNAANSSSDFYNFRGTMFKSGTFNIRRGYGFGSSYNQSGGATTIEAGAIRATLGFTGGTCPSLYGIQVIMSNTMASGSSITTLYGISVSGTTSGIGASLGTRYGIYIDYVTSYATNEYGIFQVNGFSQNVMRGSLLLDNSANNPNIAKVLQTLKRSNGQMANIWEIQDHNGIFQTGFAASGAFLPVSLADAAAPNNASYFSTDAGKYVFKDSGGVVNPLY